MPKHTIKLLQTDSLLIKYCKTKLTHFHHELMAFVFLPNPRVTVITLRKEGFRPVKQENI